MNTGMLPVTFYLYLLSFFSFASVVITFWVFKTIRKQSYMICIHFMCLSALLSYIPLFYGYIANGSIELWNVVLWSLFGGSGLLWTCMLSVLAYFLVVLKKPLKIGLVQHLICWGLPIFIVCIPFFELLVSVISGNGKQTLCYGDVDIERRCLYSLTNFILLSSTVLLMLVLVIRVVVYYLYSGDDELRTKILLAAVIRKLVPYPVILLLQTVLVLVAYNFQFSITRPLNGTFFAMAFWMNNEKIRKLWHEFYNNYSDVALQTYSENLERACTAAAVIAAVPKNSLNSGQSVSLGCNGDKDVPSGNSNSWMFSLGGECGSYETIPTSSMLLSDLWVVRRDSSAGVPTSSIAATQPAQEVEVLEMDGVSLAV